MGMPPIVRYKGMYKTNSWIRWFAARVMKLKKNNMIEVLGPTGSGKTYCAMYIAEKLSEITKKPFSVDNIVFSLEELFELINSGKLERGSIIIFDEPQISISSRNFQSLSNKAFNSLVTTFRHLGYTLLFCTPFSELLDKSTRKLFHVRITMQGINFATNTATVLPRYLEHSLTKDKTYIKRMIVLYRKTPNGNMHHQPIDFWVVNKPTEELITAYEKKKIEFTTNLNKKLYQQIINYNAKENKETDKDKPNFRSGTNQQDIWDIAQQGYKTYEDILSKLSEKGKTMSIPQLSKNIKSMRNKGYDVSKFKTEEGRGFKKKEK